MSMTFADKRNFLDRIRDVWNRPYLANIRFGDLLYKGYATASTNGNEKDILAVIEKYADEELEHLQALRIKAKQTLDELNVLIGDIPGESEVEKPQEPLLRPTEVNGLIEGVNVTSIIIRGDNFVEVTFSDDFISCRHLGHYELKLFMCIAKRIFDKSTRVDGHIGVQLGTLAFEVYGKDTPRDRIRACTLISNIRRKFGKYIIVTMGKQCGLNSTPNGWYSLSSYNVKCAAYKPEPEQWSFDGGIGAVDR